jgi:hypothetical protein
MPKGIKDWAIFLAAQTALTFVWHLLFKLGEHAMLTWSDDQIASFLGFSAPQASVVISWAIPVFLGVITLWVYHVVQQERRKSRVARLAVVYGAPSVAIGQTDLQIIIGSGNNYEKVESRNNRVTRTVLVGVKNHNRNSYISNCKLHVKLSNEEELYWKLGDGVKKAA